MSKAYMVAEERDFYQEMLMLGQDHTGRIRASSSRSRPRKVRIREYKIPDLNADPCLDMDEEEETGVVVVGLKPQDADYYSLNVPQLPYELEVEILARLPRFEYWKLKFLSTRFSRLLKEGKIFKVRRDRGLVEPSVFMRSNGDKSWTMFDKDFENYQEVPELPSDVCFSLGDKESLCAGTHLIVTGREEKSVALWRYELETSKWFKGPAMITPRILFASATRGTVAFVAGGLKVYGDASKEVVSGAEKYDSVTKTWTSLRGMHKRRQFCSGCYLRGKFYVLGGKDENDKNLTCGERYDEGTDSWELIPDVLRDASFSSIQSPPLIAVVNDNLYSLETSANELRVYDTNANVWKKLGDVPVRAKSSGGWGVAFKSLGDKLLVMGESVGPSRTETMSVYTCRPSANPEEKLVWEESKRCCDVRLSHFILNCCVMIA
ncbi:F-box/kelch-repeat protein At3g27150 [Raphanus sativus]|uniref:F-box/kelch-repeat protein At3g27150 n=1 Tax=Raphanus sativus TaxID=3726 RepID=A0A6J0N0N7_RAPSA|nr:F-box/kelch-repeat protein At3g27150 [Raphanus sativus]XP_018477535.1 F-box/kelch-repeat protein At3g27150 [Raphanus sativus]XP_018477536.1 F-box/kelch-repeat protein At3g27150 [Raphanus sativus]XP_056862906.1 F-box/kelch-repeat protein At3g27150 [Raphanus sativus]XP_056862907.1 F-box/kelch-repeat protein At3g27150 [Raphanus sativus]